MAGTQKRGLPSGVTSQQTAAVFGSPEGLGFTRSCLAIVAGSGFFFFLEALAEELDGAAPLPLPPAIFSASSATSLSLSFGLSILQKSDGMRSGRFEPLY